MNHFILFAHPKADSFNGAILDTYREALKGQGHNVEVRDLYRLGFDPILSWEEYQEQFQGAYADDVKGEQAYIEWADAVTLIYPVWWAGLPALGKGYLDRVFTYGFGYELDGEKPIPLLNGKKAATIFTSGTPEKIYEGTGMADSLKQMLEDGLFDFCGLETVGHLYFGNAVLATAKEHERMLEEVRMLATRF
ncbi:MAG TPA: NAD(P)H-dependent oxidoreductase [Bacillales bacterium]|nr:NAD(P)H-dependent oxidoreductase [Bacillales bacterium]